MTARHLTHLGELPVLEQPQRIRAINGIIITIAEEIVIAGVEELRVFAHETANGRVVGSSAVLIETVGPAVLPAGEQETIVVGCASKHIAVAVVRCRRAEDIVAVLLDHRAARVSQMGHAAFMVLLIVERLAAVCSRIAAHEDFVDPFAIHVAAR